MDIRELSNKIAKVTQNRSDEERASLARMFDSVSDQMTKDKLNKHSAMNVANNRCEM